MNSILKDNKVNTVREYILSELSHVYDEQESRLIINRLFEHYKGWNKAYLILYRDERLSESEILQFHFALKRLKRSEPIQYVLGYTHFYGLKLIVNEGVLIPRPETEELVHWVLKEHNQSNIKVFDLCTGSGCIALALKNNRPEWEIKGVDVSEEALSIAEQNAHSLELEVEFITKDVCTIEQVTADIIVSNPPYIPLSDRESMQKNVLDYEPELALFVSNEDPLVFYRSIIELGLKSASVRWIYFEIHENLSSALVEMLQKQGIKDFAFKKDLQNKTRFLKINLK